MRKIIFLIVLFTTIGSFAQVGIGISTANIDASAQLDVSSTTKGLLAPRMTNAQKNAIVNPATGLLIYQTDVTSGFYYFDGSVWKSGLGPQGIQGTQGAIGLTGATGPQGIQGATGLTGATGPQGIQGIQGATGLTGATGPQGVIGLTGATGPQGIQGIQGATGLTGETGPAGSNASISMGAISSSSTANGASITSGVLNLAPADANNSGLVTTGDQTFAGNKVFTGSNTASSFKTPTGTSSQFLKADGSTSSLDLSSFATTSGLTNNFLPKFSSDSSSFVNSSISNDGTALYVGNPNGLSGIYTGLNSDNNTRFKVSGGREFESIKMSFPGDPYVDELSFNWYNSAWRMRTERNGGDITDLSFWRTVGGTTTEQMRLTSQGYLGIGASSPSEKLDVTGNVRANSFKTPTGTSSQFLKADGSLDNNNYFISNTPNVAIGYVAGTGGQGDHSIAIGGNVAQGAQAEGGIGIGYAAAQFGQGSNSIAIGTFAGQYNQAASSVAIGDNTVTSGVNSVAIGSGASVTVDNTIQLGNSAITDVKTSGAITAAGFKTPTGTSSQFLMANGTVSNGPAALTEADDEITATSTQTSFTLTQTPASTSKVKMYINGVRISKTAYSVSGTTLTYDPSFNGNYAITGSDRIQFEYTY